MNDRTHTRTPRCVPVTLYDFERRDIEAARKLAAEHRNTEQRLDLVYVGRLERRLDDLLAIVDRLTAECDQLADQLAAAHAAMAMLAGVPVEGGDR